MDSVDPLPADVEAMIYLHIALADDSTPSAIIGGRVVASGRAMKAANDWSKVRRMPLPYPHLGEGREVTQ